MFDSDDPRAALRATGQASRMSGAASPAEYVVLADIAPQSDGAGVDSWYVRGQNFIVNHAAVKVGAMLTRDEQRDEYVVLLSDPGMGVRITTENQTREVWGPCLAIIPPGSSSLAALADGTLSRVLTVQAADLLNRCTNASSYINSKANIADYEQWPEPVDGYHLRTYSLDVPDEPGRFGRIWRCTTLMINVLPAQLGPRDPTKLSPHTHDDFEQGSLGLSGDFVHHLRWPWTTDRSQWREDQHVLCPSPSVTVIPPPVVHTTEAVGAGWNQLVDIFCPPRRDFSQKRGWVLNASEYPEPCAVGTEAH